MLNFAAARADALRISQTRPVLLEGPCGSGKSILLQHLASCTGAWPAALHPLGLMVGQRCMHHTTHSALMTVDSLSIL